MKEDGLRTSNASRIEEAIHVAEYFINKGYLENLKDYESIPLNESEQTYRYIRLCQIHKIIYAKDENVIDKLVSVYSALAQFVDDIALFIIGEPACVRIYIGIRSKSDIRVAEHIVTEVFTANFPGSKLSMIRDQDKIKDIISTALDNRSIENKISIECLSVTPALRGEKKETFVQGLEKFIDTMRGQEYVCEIIAHPLDSDDAATRRRGYEALASALSPFEKTTLAQGKNDTQTLSEGITNTVSNTISNGVSMTTGTTTGYTKGKQEGFNLGASLLVNFGFNEGNIESINSGTTNTDSITKTDAQMKAQSSIISRASATGTSETCTTEYKNTAIGELQKRIELNLKRLREGEAYGIWDCAAYMIARQKQTVAIASGTFRSLMLGENSVADRFHVNFIPSEREQLVNDILSSLCYLEHPRFRLPAGAFIKEQRITPTSLINGYELPIFLSLPRHSLPGIIVAEMTAFGRNITPTSDTSKIHAGHIYYMEQREQTPVDLDTDSLTAHCFITGSTGSGKSNTVYQLLNELSTLDPLVPFLVIEPAKGEYKKHFGALPGLKVYCSNFAYGQLLKINPFKFPEKIHILEHLDRLVEIFNACWEMYAAMPAILKDAIARTYVAKGWDLLNSVYLLPGQIQYPTFSDLLVELPKVIKQSSYSADTQGDYTGALVTRVNSLTNGIYGQIFCDDFDIDDAELFDENVIIDLSRIGSTETKSLIMGMLILRLTEYRMSSPIPMNASLRHITVLEEAHNLLKNTNKIQGTAGNQLVAKSVEMIVNSIAEMRTYGEGFLIVDQSPTSVDIAAIKNTNTKIIMRLPEKDDCDLIGKSVAIRDSQIAELPRLKVGKAVIMQSNWSEAVLAEIERANDTYIQETTPITYEKIKEFRSAVLCTLLQEFALSDHHDVEAILETIETFDIEPFIKDSMRRTIKSLCGILRESFDSVLFGRSLMKIAGCEDAFRLSTRHLKTDPSSSDNHNQGTAYTNESIDQWRQKIIEMLDRYVALDTNCRNILLQYLVYTQQFEQHEIDYRALYHEIYEIR